MNERTFSQYISQYINMSRIHRLMTLVAFAVLIQIVFHDAEVHYQSVDIKSHCCVFHQTDTDPTPPAITLVLQGVYRIYQSVATYPQIWIISKAFISPFLRAPPHNSEM